jgi:hypothetical protein
MLCCSSWFSRRYVKKSEDDPSFTRRVSRCSLAALPTPYKYYQIIEIAVSFANFCLVFDHLTGRVRHSEGLQKEHLHVFCHFGNFMGLCNELR